jgi:EmrB/QacA subfamily drug resistance transporter
MTDQPEARPWPALWALCLGFFMILVDQTIVSVATPALQHGLDADVNQVLWVTSAYLLAFAVPLLITGRLGDRFGPKNVYLVGLTVFTVSSLWCGLTDDIHQLIIARVVQGLGAALLTPQTMSVITRVFPVNRRGAAMGMWGAVAGVATLVGPILGGVLLDTLGWQWIFFVNVPVGVVGFAIALKLVPTLPTHSRSFDWPGVALSAVGMFLLVFAIQEGQNAHWDSTVWAMLAISVVIFAAFVYWQGHHPREPLVPLGLFRDRNFLLATLASAAVLFAVIGLAFPIMLFAQDVLSLSPLRAAILLVPVAVFNAVLAPFVGRLTDRVHPRYVAGIGLLLFPASLIWLAVVMKPGVEIWRLELPIALMGVAQGFVWSPLSSTATRNLAMSQAGAGSGVFNATRQVGSVLGSAAIAVLMQLRLEANGINANAGAGSGVVMPGLQRGFANAMADSLVLPAGVLVLGFVTIVFFDRPLHTRKSAAVTRQPPNETSSSAA